MAITINWATKVISVPQSDLTFVSSGLYELDVDAFRLTLKDLEDDEDGIPMDRTHNHNTEVSVGGVTLARVIEIINGYTVTFEDGQYAVRLVGANNNIADVTNVNQVSVRSNNSAGLIVSGSGVTAQDKTDIRNLILSDGTAFDGAWVREIRALMRGRWKIASNQMTLYDDDGTTPLRVFDLLDGSGQPTMTNPFERTPA